jgi:membrane-associated protease RseP (regulator of RpoE activity)
VKDQAKRRPKLITLIAIVTLISGIVSIISSIPLYNVQTALYRGGIPNEDTVTIGDVKENTPASIVGLMPGDKIISINGIQIKKTEDFTQITHNNSGIPITIAIERSGIQQSITVTPRTAYPPDQGSLGLVLFGSGVKEEPSTILIPHTILRSYMGYEEKLSPLGGPISIISHASTPYYDKTLSRLKELLLGLSGVIIGVGLLKLRKWAMFGYLLLFIVGFLTTFFTVFMKGSVILLESVPKMVNLSIIFVIVIIQVYFAWKIYSQRELFV